MRQIFLFAALIAWLGSTLCAQNNGAPKSLDAITRNILAPLDKTEITTGVLLQQAPFFVQPALFDGTTLNDQNVMDAGRFGKLFGQLRAASLEKPVLPEPAVYTDVLKRMNLHRCDTVPLALMVMQYDYIRKDAFDLGLIEWNESEKTCVDVRGRAISPYLRDTLFAFSSMVPAIKGRRAIYQLPSAWVFNNLHWEIESVEIDFGDGEGWRTVQPDEIVELNYSTAGEKILRLRVSRDNRLWTGQTRITVPEQTTAERYSDTPDETVQLSGCTLNFFFDCKDKKLRKPLIVVEGFGGALVNYTRMLDLINYDQTSPTLNEFLDNEGYDLIWVDWTDSNARIQNNSVALQEAIEYINARKHADGSNEPNAMIGSSMGGLIGKYCLLSMHNVQGKDSEVERFFTYDVPLKGANFPVGIQLMIRDLLNLSGSVASDPNIILALQLLDGDAATQMLALKAGNNSAGNLELSSAGFDAFQSEIDALEAISPLTSITRFIAISNGSDQSIGQETIPSVIAFELSLTLDGVEDNPDYWKYDVFIEATAYTSNLTNTLLYERTVKVIPIIGDVDLVESISFSTPDPLGLDVAPGGISNIGFQQLEGALNGALSNVPDQIGYYTNLAITHFCFVPTISSQSLPVGTDFYTATPASQSPATRSIATTDASQVNPYSGEPEFNQEHVSMNTGIADLLMDELQAQQPTEMLSNQLTSGQIYNFGRAFVDNVFVSTPYKITQDLNIQNGGQLWINREGRIANPDNSNNPQNLLKQRFYVYIPGNGCDETNQAIVKVESGGQLLVGEYEGNVANSGTLYFNANSALVVNAAQGVIMDDHSSMLVNEGATVTINTGGEMILNEQASIEVGSGSVFTIEPRGIFRAHSTANALIIHDGGTLIIKEGAFIELSDASQEDGGACIKIEPGGTLRIEGEFGLQGNGYFWLQGTSIVTPAGEVFTFPVYDDLRPTFTWQGEGKNVRRLFLDKFPLPIDGKTVQIVNMQLDCRGIGGILATNTAVRVVNARVEGINDAAAPSGMGIAVRNGSTVLVKNSDFVHLSRGFAVADMPNASITSPLIDGCLFQDCILGLLAYNLKQATVRLSNFNQCTGAGMALLEISSLVNLISTNISGIGGSEPLISAQLGSDEFALAGRYYYTDALEDAHISLNLLKYGIYADYVTRFRMSGGTLAGCKIGLFSPEFSHSNFVFTNQAEISGNRVGIHVQKGELYDDGETQQYFGMVMLDCARLLDNAIGILGENVLLQIDALENSGTQNPAYVRSNYFRRIAGAPAGINRLFNVCYTTGYVATTIQAKGNYWENVAPVGTGVENWRIQINGTCYALHPGSPTYMTLNRAFAPTVVPTGCPVSLGGQGPGTPGPAPQPQDPEECAPPPDSELVEKLGVYFYRAYTAYGADAETTGDFTISNGKFEAVANIKNDNLPLMDEKCQNYVRMSRAFVSAYPNGKPDNPRERRMSAAGNIQVQPNPASESILIRSSADEVQNLRVFNAQGRLVREITLANGVAELQVSDWPNGIYLIGNVGQAYQVPQKFIVQH